MLSIIPLLEEDESEDTGEEEKMTKKEKRKRLLKRVALAGLSGAAVLHATNNLSKVINK